MSIHSDRIRLLIQQSGCTYQDLEKRTGIKKSTLQRYASGVTAKIPLEAMEALSSAFDVPLSYLTGSESDPAPGLTEGEEMLLDLFRQVPEDKRQLVLQMIRAALETAK